MIWAAFSLMGRLQIQFTSSKMNSANYIEILQESLLPFLRCFGRIIKFIF